MKYLPILAIVAAVVYLEVGAFLLGLGGGELEIPGWAMLVLWLPFLPVAAMFKLGQNARSRIARSR